MSDKITISIASLPERNYFLSRTVASLYDQCDQMFVYLNKYDLVPTWFDKYPKCVAAVHDNYYGDGTRYHIQPDSGWWLTCDDDIVYPPDYVQYMIQTAERYKRGAIVTLHGSVMAKRELLTYHGPDSREKVYRCLATVEDDVQVDVGGTGVMCFHCDTFRPDLSRFERKNMADIWVAVQAKEQGIPIIVARHEVGYLQYQLPPDKWTIWKDTERNIEQSAYQAGVLNRYFYNGGN